MKRKAARVVLLDEQKRVFLFQFARRNGERFWATPGGGLEQGESFEQAARREALEELGLALPLLRPLWVRFASFPWNDDLIEQEEQFFVALLDTPFPVDPALVVTHHDEGIVGHRWWTLNELGSTKELVFPEGLGISLSDLPP